MSAAEAMKIVVAAAPAVVCRGLADLARTLPGASLAGVGEPESALALCTQHRPDVLVLYPAGPAALMALERLRDKQPGLHALLVLDAPAAALNGMRTGDEVLPLAASEVEFQAALAALAKRAGRRPPAGPAAPDGAAPALRDQRIAQELVMAGKMQASILPQSLPSLPGWDFAARLVSARETSGDFYDFIPMPGQNWGVIIADVADKGMGAALYMSLVSTLFRNFAGRHPSLPALAMDTVNERLMADTHGGMFVSAFFGVIETKSGRLRYANAGHPPPLVVRTRRAKSIDQLDPTGMVLGVLENFHWKQKLITLAPGDVLVLYTDGVSEVQDEGGRFFESARLEEVIWHSSALSAQEILENVLTEIRRFSGSGGLQDDVALVVIRRLGG